MIRLVCLRWFIFRIFITNKIVSLKINKTCHSEKVETIVWTYMLSIFISKKNKKSKYNKRWKVKYSGLDEAKVTFSVYVITYTTDLL